MDVLPSAWRPLRYLVLGPDRGGNLLELVVLDRPQGTAVIHAMKTREKYRSLLPAPTPRPKGRS